MKPVVNKKAKFEYEIIETLQAGIILQGTEVKSIHNGQVNISDSFIQFKNGELFLVNAHISQYTNAYKNTNHEPNQDRKLLLHKRELSKLKSLVDQKGIALVPTKLYTERKKIKVEVGVGKGKKLYDKRETIKRRDIEKDTQRELKKYK